MLLLAAAALLLILGLAHSVLGERYILVRLFKRSNLPQLFGGTAFTTGTLRFAWHLTTIAWWALAAVLVLAALGPLARQQVLMVVAVSAIASAVLPLLFTRGKHLSWVVLLLVAALVAVAGQRAG